VNLYSSLYEKLYFSVSRNNPNEYVYGAKVWPNSLCPTPPQGTNKPSLWWTLQQKTAANCTSMPARVVLNDGTVSQQVELGGEKVTFNMQAVDEDGEVLSGLDADLRIASIQSGDLTDPDDPGRNHLVDTRWGRLPLWEYVERARAELGYEYVELRNPPPKKK
jgi:hypothetical protein